MNKNEKIKTNCRMCKSNNLTQYLDLGHHPPSDQFITSEQRNQKNIVYPLKVLLCLECGLSQLNYVVDPTILFQQEYPYDSSTTKTGRDHYHQMAKNILQEYNVAKNELIIDIGSNVGVLLEGFKQQQQRVMGVDPAPNIAAVANQNGIDTICDFFGEKSANQITKEKGQAAIITGTNVFAHVDNLDKFMKGIQILLKKNGIFVIESPYMQDLVDKLAYDTIYHEHVSYLSVKPLMSYFKQFDMEIIDIQRTRIHGGSFRLFVSRIGEYQPKSSVNQLLQTEKNRKLHSLSAMQRFANKVEQNRQQLRYLLAKLKHQKKRIAAVSAPAKGMTLLNYCKIGTETLDFATEKNPLKIGRYTPGGNIPVVPDETLQKEKPEYALLLAWNFAPEIIKNLKFFQQRNGKFIIPLPIPQIITSAS